MTGLAGVTGGMQLFANLRRAEVALHCLVRVAETGANGTALDVAQLQIGGLQVEEEGLIVACLDG